MAELGSTNVNGDLKTTGDHTVGENSIVKGNHNVQGDSDIGGTLSEKGQRVYSPNNRNISNSVASASDTVYASSLAAKTAYDRGTSAINTANGKLDKTATAVNSTKLNGQAASYYARAAQVLTNVPAGAKFTDTNTWRGVTTSVSSTSTTVSASASAVKAAYDRATSAINTANTKLASGGKAVDSAKLNGAVASASASANQIALRDSSADLQARLFRSNYSNESRVTGAMAFRVSTSDNYIRFCSNPSAIRAWLGVYSKDESNNAANTGWTLLRSGAQVWVYQSPVDLQGKEVCFIQSDRKGIHEVSVAKGYVPVMQGFDRNLEYFLNGGNCTIKYQVSTRKMFIDGELGNRQIWYRTPPVNEYPNMGTIRP